MRRTITTAAITAALVVPGTATGAQAENPTCETMVGSVTSADAAEGRILRCLDAIETAYTDCMLNAPGTADSLERWAPLCRAAGED